jgi:hypothetical protein
MAVKNLWLRIWICIVNKWKKACRTFSDMSIGIVLAAAIIIIALVLNSLQGGNPDWVGALAASGTMILAVAAFAQINSQTSDKKDKQKSIYNIFIERIKNWIEVIDQTREEIHNFNKNKPAQILTFKEAVALAAYNRVKESGSTGTGMTSSESQETLAKAIQKFNEFLKPNYILLNILKRSEEYQILLKENNLLAPEAISELIALFDYIYLFNIEISEAGDENNKQYLILLKTPMLKVLCIECLLYLFREADLNRKNKKLINKYKDDLKSLFDEFKGVNKAFLQSTCQRIQKISDEFYIDLNNN